MQKITPKLSFQTHCSTYHCPPSHSSMGNSRRVSNLLRRLNFMVGAHLRSIVRKGNVLVLNALPAELADVCADKDWDYFF